MTTAEGDIIAVDDPADERLTDYLRLTDVKLRSVLEPAEGLYMAESPKVLTRALDAGHRPRSLLVTPRWVDELPDLLARVRSFGAPVYVASEPVARELTGFHLHRGVLAAMHRPVLPSVAEVLGAQGDGTCRARRVVVLEDIVDHTNVGAIFRSAAAMSADAVLVTPRCADPLYRRSVRVSMGTVFQVPWTRIDPWPQGIETLREHGMTVAALALAPGGITLDDLEAKAPERLALVLGTEGDGLSARTVAAADLAVRIPMGGGVDSLNVAAAGAVALWSLRPRRQ